MNLSLKSELLGCSNVPTSDSIWNLGPEEPADFTYYHSMNRLPYLIVFFRFNQFQEADICHKLTQLGELAGRHYRVIVVSNLLLEKVRVRAWEFRESLGDTVEDDCLDFSKCGSIQVNVIFAVVK